MSDIEVQNPHGHSVDVAGGPTLAPGDRAKVEPSDEIDQQIAAGMLMKVSKASKTR